MCISIIATVIVYIYTVTIVFYFIFFLSPLSSDSLSSSNFFLLLYSLKSNNKSIQIIKFFKLILNLDFKFIKPSPLKNKKNHQTQIAKEEEENAEVVEEEEDAKEEEEVAVESPKSLPTIVEKSAQNYHPNCKPKITGYNQTRIAKEKEEGEEEDAEEERRRRTKRKRESVQRSNEFGVCHEVGGTMGRCEIIEKE